LSDNVICNYSPRAGLLDHRVIVITGADNDIGRCAAQAFAAHGATAVLLGHNPQELNTTYDRIEEAGTPQPAIYAIDPAGASPDDYQELAAVLEREFGHLDGLLHTSAMLGALTPLEHYKPELWARVIEVNLNAPFLLTCACLPLLKRSTDASVLFSTADVGRKGRAYWGAYGVSMSGIEGMMQILADELEVNTTVRANSIDPGPVRSALRLTAYPAEDSSHLPQPAEVMNAYLYLIGPDSQGITGRSFNAQ